MRIAMVSEHASPLAVLGGVDAGGQNVHVAALSAALVRLGHAVTVYTRRDDPALPARVTMPPGVVVAHVDAGPARAIPKDAIFGHVPRLTRELARLFEADRPDVVHAHFWMSGMAALAAARPLGIPVVTTFHALGCEKRRHQGLADTSPPERIAAETRIAREADRIVATASAEVFELLRLGANPRTLKIVPCGVDLEAFAPSGPCDAPRGAGLRVVTLSRLVPRKGIDTAIEALAALPDAELVVAGGGEAPDLATDPEAARLAALARRLGVARRVTFRGRVAREHVPALLRSADAVVCTPWYEPFGIVPLEAMACAVPVVVSAVGGLVDTVVDGITGYHVAPRDPAGVAGALAAFRDEHLRRAMGRAGHNRVRARYAWSRIAAQTLDVYRALAARSNVTNAGGGLATGS